MKILHQLKKILIRLINSVKAIFSKKQRVQNSENKSQRVLQKNLDKLQQTQQQLATKFRHQREVFFAKRHITLKPHNIEINQLKTIDLSYYYALKNQFKRYASIKSFC